MFGLLLNQRRAELVADDDARNGGGGCSDVGAALSGTVSKNVPNSSTGPPNERCVTSRAAVVAFRWT